MSPISIKIGKNLIMKNWLFGQVFFPRIIDLIKIFPLVSFLRSRSYSQFWEDRLINRLLIPSIGSYVDIGAGMPTWGSNTYLFYKKGWEGVTVDPIKFNILLHKFIRRKDRQYRSLVSRSITEIPFYEIIPWELSTTDYLIADLRVKNGAKILRKEIMNAISLERIYDENPIVRPAILSIDVEGAEMEVLQSNNWKKYSPDLICVEELDNPLDESQIRSFLSDRKYLLVAYNGVSSIYAWQESAHLIDL